MDQQDRFDNALGTGDVDEMIAALKTGEVDANRLYWGSGMNAGRTGEWEIDDYIPTVPLHLFFIANNLAREPDMDVYNKNLELLEALLQAGAEPNIMVPDTSGYGNGPGALSSQIAHVLVATEQVLDEFVPHVELLLKYGMDIDWSDGVVLTRLTRRGVYQRDAPLTFRAVMMAEIDKMEKSDLFDDFPGYLEAAKRLLEIASEKSGRMTKSARKTAAAFSDAELKQALRRTNGDIGAAARLLKQ